MDNEKDIIKQLERDKADNISFFSESRKRERERWIVEEFLGSLGIAFDKSQIKNVDPDPPDVEFQTARFEAKEILDKGRKRHQKEKEDLKEIQKAKRLIDLKEPYVSPKEISTQEVFALIDSKISGMNYSDGFCNEMDLLFYVNLQNCYISKFDKGLLKNKNNWRKWRSLSVVTNGKKACVLWVSKNAPEFLKNNY